MFVQATKSRRNGKTYVTYLVRESFRTPKGPRSRTVCNISQLPDDVRQLVADSLSGRTFLESDAIELEHALDCGGLAVLVHAWKEMGLNQLLQDIGTERDRALIKAMVFSRLLFPCAKLALKEQAQGTLLAQACGLSADERFDEDDLYAAMDSITGHWCALEKGLAANAFKEPVSLVLYDLTSTYFESNPPFGENDKRQFGYSRDKRSDCVQVVIALVVLEAGVPCLLGAGLGVGLAGFLAGHIQAIMPPSFAIPTPTISKTVFVGAGISAFVLAFISAALPALRLMRMDIATALSGRT